MNADRALAVLVPLLLRHRKALTVVANLALAAAAYMLAFALRFDLTIPPQHLPVVLAMLPWLLVCKLVGFSVFGLSAGSWRQVGVRDVGDIVRGNVVASIVFLASLVFGRGLAGFPRSVFLLDLVLHPRATIGPNARIGEGSYVAAGAIITIDVHIGRFATLNFHCQVAHHSSLEDFVTLHPDVHLAGHVSVGEGAELGTGAIAIPGVSIGPWAILGAGCVAVRSLPGGATFVGVPAKVLLRDADPMAVAAR